MVQRCSLRGCRGDSGRSRGSRMRVRVRRARRTGVNFCVVDKKKEEPLEESGGLGVIISVDLSKANNHLRSNKLQTDVIAL